MYIASDVEEGEGKIDPLINIIHIDTKRKRLLKTRTMLFGFLDSVVGELKKKTTTCQLMN